MGRDLASQTWVQRTTIPIRNGDQLNKQKHMGINVGHLVNQNRNEDSKKESINIGCIRRNRVLKTRQMIIILARPVLENQFLFGASPLRGQ